MSIDKTDIFEYAHWSGMPEPVIIGILSANQGKGRKSFSFECDEKYFVTFQGETGRQTGDRVIDSRLDNISV